MLAAGCRLQVYSLGSKQYIQEYSNNGYMCDAVMGVILSGPSATGATLSTITSQLI